MKMTRRILTLALALLLICSSALAASYSFSKVQASPFFGEYDAAEDNWTLQHLAIDDNSNMLFWFASGSKSGELSTSPCIIGLFGEHYAETFIFEVSGKTYTCTVTPYIDDMTSYFVGADAMDLYYALLDADSISVTMIDGSARTTLKLSGSKYATGVKAFVQEMFDLGIIDIIKAGGDTYDYSSLQSYSVK